MTKLKVLQVVADGAAGGGTTFVLGLSEDLRADGRYDVEIVTAPNSYAQKAADDSGFVVHPVNFFASRFDFRLPFLLRRVVDKSAPVLVHVHGARAAMPFTFFSLKTLAIPLLYTVHGYHFEHKPWPMRQLATSAERLISARMDLTIFVSNSDRDIAIRNRLVDDDEAPVIYNGIGDRSRYTGPRDEKVADITYVGRLVRQKNPIFAVEIMSELRDAGLTMAIVGGGELEPDVRQRIAELGLTDHVRMLGPVSREVAIAAIARSRIYLMPSLWEGLPITPMEAMINGVPVVASKVGGTDEVVMDGETGFLIEDFSPKKYAEAIFTILTNKNLYEALSAASRTRVAVTFDRKKSSNLYMEQYRKILGA